ncbi:MAG: helix-turn-helix domain-containing protein [Candidatus Omnitrophota bacterium]
MTDDIMTTSEVLKYLKISRMTLYKWMRKKKLPFHKLGGRYRYRTNEIDKWISKR